MKKLLTLTMVLAAVACMGQFKKSEVLNRSYRFENSSIKNVFQVSNINGSISVEVHEKDQIDLIVNKMITGKTTERADRGMKEISIALLDRYDTIIAYVSGPCMRFGNYTEGKWNRYGYKWNDCNLDYDFKMDMTLRVPAGTNLVLSTVNEGDINVKDVKGNLHVNNVNGAIALNGVEGKVYAHTINGDIDIYG